MQRSWGQAEESKPGEHRGRAWAEPVVGDRRQACTTSTTKQLDAYLANWATAMETLNFFCHFTSVETNHLKQPTTVHEERAFISADVHDNLTLQCVYDSITARYYWYKQKPGQKLQLISLSYQFEKDGTFFDEFKDNPRFTLKNEAGKTLLTILDVQVSDTATYFCAIGNSFMYEFGEWTTVIVKDSGLNIHALVHQSESVTIQSRGSVTLNCTVHTGTCDGQHNVYWLKESGEPHPGKIHIHEGSSYRCERNPDTQTQTCVYNLLMKNLNVSHAGTYYCAVASCGHILFGNRTKFIFESELDSLVFVYFLIGALTFTTILSFLLAFSLYKMHKRKCSQT
ncbi:uncharacterized protein LOC142368759 [Odontesthes bonariensis]|uniref:uncharacterized protein LOC142368759 n=1 Tax=Odontesthes bonariensis TaxID=219752 RepID=UPI003F58C33C